MCWKHEWAMAINNLQWAIKHIDRAKSSLKKRLERNKKNLERHGGKDKQIEALIQKNQTAIECCNQLQKLLRHCQDQLYRMIQIYGIKRKESSKRLRRLMGDYKPIGE